MKASAPGIAAAGVAQGVTYLAGAEGRRAYLTISTDKAIHTLTNESSNGYVTKTNKAHNEVGAVLEAAGMAILGLGNGATQQAQPALATEPAPVALVAATSQPAAAPTVVERLREMAELAQGRHPLRPGVHRRKSHAARRPLTPIAGGVWHSWGQSDPRRAGCAWCSPNPHPTRRGSRCLASKSLGDDPSRPGGRCRCPREKHRTQSRSRRRDHHPATKPGRTGRCRVARSRRPRCPVVSSMTMRPPAEVRIVFPSGE